MILENIASIRTGVVATRKKAGENDPVECEYNLINLKCASPAGYLDLQYAEKLQTSEKLKQEYFTQMDDILVRRSAPYTTIMTSRSGLRRVISAFCPPIRIPQSEFTT